MTDNRYQTIKVEREEGVTFLSFNRPEKRNAMSPRLSAEMVEALTELEAGDLTPVLVITGQGEAFTSGMDMQEFTRSGDGEPAARLRARSAARTFQHQKLLNFPGVTIAMVNGWCIGGGFSVLTSCDLAVAAEEATFGISGVNWGSVPGGYVTKDVTTALGHRHAFYYLLTGEPFDGRRAAEIGLVNFAVPRAELRAKTMELARKLMRISPAVLRAAKQALRAVRTMSYDEAWDYLMAKNDQLRLRDSERSRDRGIQQFIDEKRYRPGLGPQPRPQ